ncbi:MAG: O-methyltransferase [Chloroflexota bacterium]|nr:O-methyltransferase [Chloroflexota bacterium]
MNETITGQLRDYVDNLFVREDEALAFVRRQTAEHGLPQINLQPHEGLMVQLFVRMCAARKVVEVGALAGYSAIWIARALPGDGQLITIDKSSEHCALARAHIQRAGLADKVSVLQGDGRQVLDKLAVDAPFDALFVDADKVSYPHYFSWAAEHLRRGGIVMAHNAFWSGQILSPQSEDDYGLVRFNQMLAEHRSFESTIIEVGDGLALGVKVD